MFEPTISLAVRAEAADVWNALTDPAVTPAYYYGFAAHWPTRAGDEYRYEVGGSTVITGRVLELEPGSRVRMTFAGTWAPDVAELPESEVTITLEPPTMPMPGVTVLTLEHRGLPDSPTSHNVAKGWVLILSGLKTLLETGTPLVPAA